jgi:N-acetylglucosaminyldiphosphoundecaprenol N-acetyl-beta-D-mannosaminyltransferase
MSALKLKKIIDLVKPGVSITKSVDLITDLVDSGDGGYVCFMNVHMAIAALNDKTLFDSLVNSSLIVPDGKPISVFQRNILFKESSQVRGPDVFEFILNNKPSLNVALIGANIKTLEKIELKVLQEDIGANIVLKYSPPYCAVDDMDISKISNLVSDSKADIAFIGLGCPKQEIFMSKVNESCSAIFLGVGAAFDFYSGQKKIAPKLFHKYGLEWFFRLLCEPQRLFKRYAYSNLKFITLYLKNKLGIQ